MGISCETDHENDTPPSRVSTRAAVASIVGKEALVRIYMDYSFMSFRWFSIYCIALMIWICGAAHAQQPGVLEGRVMDPSGAVIPGASVLVEPQPSGPVHTVQTDGEGR